MPRETPFTFTFPSPAQAVAALISHIIPVSTEPIPLHQSPGRILAKPILSDRPSPAVDLSSMDGYAVRLSDVADTLPIAGEVRIGRQPPSLPPNSALRIVTGGSIPPGADLVIKREDTTEYPDHINIAPAARSKLKPGDNIRRTGENLHAGTEVVPAGTLITPAVAAALAAFGITHPLVHKRIAVAIITTGDEVIPIGHQPTPWQLRNSNAASLEALLATLPFAEAYRKHVSDDANDLAAAVALQLALSDALVLTGGVSMGHRDYVSDALAANQVRSIFHGLPQRPGKPILAGIGQGPHAGKPILALPGNPVSVIVTARRIALPALLARAGFRDMGLAAHALGVIHVTNPDTKTTDLWWHRPVRITSPGQAELIDAKSSGDIVGAARSDGFIELPPNQHGPGPWPFYPWHF